MAFTKLTNQLNTIEQLPDTPNRTSGYTAAQMKAFFDQNAQLIKTFINDTLISELEDNGATSGYSGAKNIAVASREEFADYDNIEDVLIYFRGLIREAVAGQIGDNDIKTRHLNHEAGYEAVDTGSIRDGAVTNAKLAGGITEDKIKSVLTTVLDGLITNAQLEGKISYDKLAGGIRASQLYGEIPADKIKSVDPDTFTGVVPAEKGGTGTTLGAQAPKKTATVTLAKGASTWNVACSSVTASNTVIVGPITASRDTWNDNGVYCSAQGDGTLTFKSEVETDADITVNVLVFD